MNIKKKKYLKFNKNINKKNNKIKKKLKYKKNINLIKKKQKNQNITNNKTFNNNYYKKYKNLKKLILLKRPKGNLIKQRPPIITIMGHVNHGKTSLIDCIKSSKLVNDEVGNITQHINAYNIIHKLGKFTLLDTPGHETFFDMRKRGIKLADLIILIIAIDDGIMPQTIEIIKYNIKFKIPIIIAINKIDKINYLNNIKTIKQKLQFYNILPKKLGGNNIFVKISTKKNLGINKLINSIFNISFNLKLKTNINQMAEGIILDSSINKNIGFISKILIKKGTLKINDIILCDDSYGKIKNIWNDNNIKIYSASPSMAITISGINKQTKLGKKFIIINNLKEAKKLSNIKLIINKEKKWNNITNNNLNNFKTLKPQNNKLNILLKTNSISIIKTLKYFIKKNMNKKIHITYYNIGDINENDILYAKTTNSIIITFNININNNIKKINQNNIKIYNFNIIYKLINKLNKLYSKKIINKSNPIILGKAIIQDIFKISKLDCIAGCKIIEGFINIKNKIQIIRNNNKIYQGTIKSLQKFKEKINIIHKNSECGIHIKNFNNIKINDQIISINE